MGLFFLMEKGCKVTENTLDSSRITSKSRKQTDESSDSSADPWMIVGNDWEFNNVNSSSLCGKVAKEIGQGEQLHWTHQTCVSATFCIQATNQLKCITMGRCLSVASFSHSVISLYFYWFVRIHVVLQLVTSLDNGYYSLFDCVPVTSRIFLSNIKVK